MQTIRMFFAASALAGSMLAFSTPASAVTSVSIGLQEAGINSGGVFTEGTGVTSASVIGLSYGVYNINSIIGQMGVSPDLINSTALDAISSTTAGTLHVFVTEQGLTNPISTKDFISSFTSNVLPAGWTATEATFLDSADGLYTTVTPLASDVFSTIGSAVQSIAAATGAGPYSLTEEYTLVAGGRGSSSNTIDISASAVPEPATWAGMLIGFGGLGAAIRSKRRKPATVF